jgi:hypothetical protein
LIFFCSGFCAGAGAATGRDLDFGAELGRGGTCFAMDLSASTGLLLKARLLHS